jgi:hypothetical protein
MEIMEGVRPGRDDGRDVAILMATSIVIMIYHDAVGGDGVLSGFAAVAAVHSDRGAAVREKRRLESEQRALAFYEGDEEEEDEAREGLPSPRTKAQPLEQLHDNAASAVPSSYVHGGTLGTRSAMAGQTNAHVPVHVAQDIFSKVRY